MITFVCGVRFDSHLSHLLSGEHPLRFLSRTWWRTDASYERKQTKSVQHDHRLYNHKGDTWLPSLSVCDPRVYASNKTPLISIRNN